MPLNEIAEHSYVLTPGRYVGAEEVEDDDEPFEERMKHLCSELRAQRLEVKKLDDTDAKELARLGFDV